MVFSESPSISAVQGIIAPILTAETHLDVAATSAVSGTIGSKLDFADDHVLVTSARQHGLVILCGVDTVGNGRRRCWWRRWDATWHRNRFDSVKNAHAALAVAVIVGRQTAPRRTIVVRLNA